eukprot:15472275-Alexandrium_andersonii.AAC.1
MKLGESGSMGTGDSSKASDRNSQGEWQTCSVRPFSPGMSPSPDWGRSRAPFTPRVLRTPSPEREPVGLAGSGAADSPPEDSCNSAQLGPR